MTIPQVFVREALDQDIKAIKEIFHQTYNEDYPYVQFFSETWLKYSIYNDNILLLVACNSQGEIIGTMSVIFGISAFNDLVGEFGRLAVSPKARGLGVASVLMEKGMDLVKGRINIAIVENRCVHTYSQKISLKNGFRPIGLLPMKHKFNKKRESIALFYKHWGEAMDLRKNHPHIIPEVQQLAHRALLNCNLKCDTIICEKEPSYPYYDQFDLHNFDSKEYTPLLRMEGGRISRREIFGPMRLQYGLFRLNAQNATYLVAGHKGSPLQKDPAGAIGYIFDEIEKCVRIFELISSDERSIRFLIQKLIEISKEKGAEYIEADVSAYAPRMQKTLLEHGFLPTGYLPGMVFHHVERLDAIKMSLLLVPIDFEEMTLLPESTEVAGEIMAEFKKQLLDPIIEEKRKSLNLFDDLNDEQSRKIAGHFTLKSYEAGAQLFGHGESTDQLFAIFEGTVNLVSKNGKLLTIHNPDDVVGEISFITGGIHSVSAVTQNKVTLGILDSRTLTAITRKRPDIGVIIYRNLAKILGLKIKDRYQSS